MKKINIKMKIIAVDHTECTLSEEEKSKRCLSWTDKQSIRCNACEYWGGVKTTKTGRILYTNCLYEGEKKWKNLM